MYLYELKLIVGRLNPRSKIHIVELPGGSDLDGFRPVCKCVRFSSDQIRLAEPGDDIHLCNRCCTQFFGRDEWEIPPPLQDCFREIMSSCTRALSVEIRVLPYAPDPEYVLLSTKDLNFIVERLRGHR